MSNGNSNIIHEISGIVTKIIYPNDIQVYDRSVGKIFTVVYRTFFHIKVNDSIICKCIEENGKYVILPNTLPFVQISTNKESIISCLVRCTKKSSSQCIRLYNSLLNLCDNKPEEVSNYLSNLAKKYSEKKDIFVINELTSIMSENQIKNLLNWWHKERDLRKLFLLGLTPYEINKSKMTCDKIYEKCIKNPYALYFLEMSKCKMISETLGLPNNNTILYCGEIVRYIYNASEKKRFSCVKESDLKLKFPLYEHYTDILEKDYDILKCDDYYQIKYNYQVETEVSKYIINLMKKNWVYYDTPLDEVIKGKIRRQALYTNPKLSEDQKIAIQGALDHSISVITAPSGRGKCMGKGTKILMFDGSIKNVEDIKVGDQLMGMNSKPRNVLSLATGIDDMYEIIPKYGSSFVCNSSHILTMKEQPYRIDHYPIMKKGEYNYIIYYTQKGWQRIICYDEKYKLDNKIQEINEYFKNPNNQYFDISLQDWMKGIRHGNLFRGNVDFPYQYVENPYQYGFNLCSSNQRMKIEYKINSKEVRIQVFKGIVDSINNSKFSEDLLEDIKFLASTLHYYLDINEDGSYLFIYTPIIDSFKVKFLKQDQYYGFELDGDGRYLLHDCIVTHNTTCIEQIVYNLELRGEKFAVCSFTGKAVARAKEVTRGEAYTMDRLIANSSNEKFIIDHVIIDESSMVTTELFYRFIKKFPYLKKITFVGDINQLPPIEWGSLFFELIKSKTIPVYYLIYNHRFESGKEQGVVDGIIRNADAIICQKNNVKYNFITASDEEFIPNFYLSDGGIEKVEDILLSLKKFDVNKNEITIICPYNDELDELNKLFQSIFSKNQPGMVDYRKRLFKLGDRVIHTENDYQIGVFNGTEGIITKINESDIVVKFPDIEPVRFFHIPTNERYINEPQTKKKLDYRNRVYDKIEDGTEVVSNEDMRTMDRLDISFSITVDKSQGSEYLYVIYYVPDRKNNQYFVNKNRTYTAITRAKLACYVVGNITQIEKGIANTPYNRIENLSNLLKSQLNNIEPYNQPFENYQFPGDVNNLDDIEECDYSNMDYGDMDW